MIDICQITSLITEIAQQEALPRFRKLSGDDIIEKKAGDLVTIADLMVEKVLTERLLDLLPGSLVVGEEAVEADAGVLDRLSNSEAPLWIIDPIDGTGNFARGNETFAVMLALCQGDETLAAWIHDPVSGETAVAEKGAGAFFAGERLQTSPSGTPSEMAGTLHASQFATSAMARQIDKRRKEVQAVKSLSCAGHEYIRLAKGDMHFTFFSKTKPWDHIPGFLLCEEAGGYGAVIDGQKYRPRDHSAPGVLMAPNRKAWEDLHQVFFEGKPLESFQ